MLIIDREFGLDELPSIAQSIAALTGTHRLFTFEGDLGAGKTTLVKAICEKLGVAEKVASPTYSLVNQYQGEREGSMFPVFHIDLYRLDSAEEAYHAGIEEILGSDDICLVEWPQRLPEILEQRRVAVSLQASSPGLRRIQVYSHEN